MWPRGAALGVALCLLAGRWSVCGGADLVIEIPGGGGGGGVGGGDPDAHYRLEYRPPHGHPAPNFTVPARAATINFQGLPGTQYHFMLYYSNDTFADLLTWNQTIITAPEPPTNLTVSLGRNKQATISWSPPAHGEYTGFRFKVIPLPEGGGGGGGVGGGGGARNITVSGAGNWTHTLRELSPGATYQLHAVTLLHDKESAAYASRNFTTKPNTPGKFIVWFRNETTLLVLWQPPYPPGAYTHYKVSIVPADARDSELYVEKEGEPPGPAQAAFKGLVPGRAYNISVQTVSEPEVSAPTTAQYRTVPLRPRSVAAPAHARTETSFRAVWLPPLEHSEFEKYQVSVSAAGGAGGGGGGGARRLSPVVRARNETAEATFDGLEPGAHYTVTVKTMSGKVTSWPAHADLTLKPLPVRELRWRYLRAGEGDGGAGAGAEGGGGGGGVLVWWAAAAGSTQDEYRVSYHEAGPSRDDSSALTTAAPNATLAALLPGRNYTVAVAAVSRGTASNDTAFAVATPPLAPVLRAAAPLARALRLAWSSDVNSRQDSYRLRYRRLASTSASAPAQYATLETRDTSATLEQLTPGAVYEVQLCALSHHLPSEWHTVLKPVRPLPAEWLSVERATSNSVHVHWRGPRPAGDGAGGGAGGEAGLVGHYALRYRPLGDATWSTHAPYPPHTEHAEIVNMTHGERYEIQLDTVSEAAGPGGGGGGQGVGGGGGGGETVDSGEPLRAEHTVRPNPVSDVAALVDTRNVTLEWPRPAGRVEWYALRWWHRETQDGAGVAGEGEGEGGGEGGGEGEGVTERVVSGAGSAGAGRAVLAGLVPGAGYALTLAAHSYNMSSELFTMDTRTRPLITSEMTIVNESGDYDNDTDTEPAILVLYTRTPRDASRFDSYRFRLEGERGGEGGGDGGEVEPARWETRPADGAGQQVAFRGLVPGRLYNVTMWTVSRNVTSHPVQRQARLFPRPVGSLRAVRVGAREVSLAWSRPLGAHTDYEVQYLAAADTLANRTTAAAALTLTGLRPHTLYTFSVEVRAGTPGTLLTRSPARSVAVSTREAPPAAPDVFQPADATPSAVTFVWRLPAAARHGLLRRYVLRYGPQGEPGEPGEAEAEREGEVREVEFPADATRGEVRGLAPGRTYWFLLRGESGAGPGEAARWTQHMGIGAPPRPPAAALPAPVRRSPTTVAVRFRGDYFSPANGNVTAYTLVVSEEPRNESALRLPAWRDVRGLALWPPYQVTEPYYPFGAGAVEEFTIGAERCEAEAAGVGGRAYCNGPLKPGARYYVKLRAFTAPDKFTDTGYALVYTEVDNTAWIIGGSVCGAAVLCGALALLALRRRRARRKGWAGAASGGRAGPQGAHGHGPGPAGPARASRPVRVADFCDHYRLMSADSDFRFSEEFEELKHVGREQPCTAADLPCNRPKNRFTNILPYDHSRYKLQPVDDEEGSDYINANYVPGHLGPREFVVTQGPLHCTRDDFWRMTWESGSRALVMLTRCVEKGREKCDRYWPYDTRPLYYGDIAVTALNESRYPDWTVTELMVCRGNEQRVVKHFHFTTWPDFGVPDPPTTLVRFVRAFRERCPSDARPVVVHCSAGVGRSGTFITLDRALQQLSAHAEHLDIFGMVHALRRERVWMVQTEQQYICVHQCVVAVLEGLELQPPHLMQHHNQAFEDDEGIAESGM